SMNLTPLFVGILLLPAQPTTKLDVELSFAKGVLAEPFSGRVFVMATKSPSKGQPPGLAWFGPQPCFAQDVAKWTPDTPLKFAPMAAHPKTWEALAKEKY